MSALARSLELLGERGVDPSAEIYARVFARWPETERLFFRDRDGAIRGHMLFEVIEAVLDLAGERRYARGFIADERVHHADDLTVSDEAYIGFVAILRDVVRDRLGADWTAAMATAWAELIAEIEAPA